MAHVGGPPVTAGVDDSSRVGWLVNGVYNNFWNGSAAVIVFFVISGFCIHYPFSTVLRIPSLYEYAARRYLRIGIPLAVAMLISPYVNIKLELFHDSILWSLFAELMYYTLYPGLLALRRAGVSWIVLFSISYVCALILAGSSNGNGNYASFGVGLNWLLGLPCWLAGCELAERMQCDVGQCSEGRLFRRGSIWFWRATIFTTSVALSILRFHTPFGYPWTLNAFSVLVAIWLGCEILYYTICVPWEWLEWAGKWSYSVYLVHMPASAIFTVLGLPDLGCFINWLLLIAFILAASYVFYACVEYPGHLIARAVGKMVSSHRGMPKIKFSEIEVKP